MIYDLENWMMNAHNLSKMLTFSTRFMPEIDEVLANLLN